MKMKKWFSIIMVVSLMMLSLPLSAAAYDIPSVKADYGAVGNGTTDDTTSFQNALNAGKHIYVPPGTYKITGNLTFSSNSGLIGTKDAIIQLTGASIKLAGSNVSNIYLKDITIKRTVTGTSNAIELIDTKDIVIDGVNIIDNKSNLSAIYIEGEFNDTSETTTSENILITNVLIKNYQRIDTGGLGNGTNQGVMGNGIELRFSKNFIISNNLINETQTFFTGTTVTRYGAIGIRLVSSINGDIVGNQIDKGGYGIGLDGGISTAGQTTSTGMRGASWNTITGNSINNMYSVGLDMRNGSSYNTVSSNTINQAALAGIWLNPGSLAPTYNCVVKGNIITGNTVTDTGSGIGDGAWTVAGSRRETGIAIEPFENNSSVRVTQNVIIGNNVIDNKGNMTYGISDSGVFGYSTPSNPFSNRFAANNASGAITSNFSIDTTRNSQITWP